MDGSATEVFQEIYWWNWMEGATGSRKSLNIDPAQDVSKARSGSTRKGLLQWLIIFPKYKKFCLYM